MKVELTRFRVKEGKSDLVDEWLAFLNEQMDAVLETLEPEKMYVETIFCEELDGVEYLYWYSVQGEGAQDVSSSEHWLDRKHLDYWQQCIDPAYKPVDLQTEVVLIPDRIRQKMV
ncbi:DUF6176 family protein [Jeotgalibacillus aurantiacus]|uniref:DUF6176 family protein n=1 Tax=Jeotgalibacillus aurantiacus TaxID=2763266 RepID=UPI001D0AA51C|nr:DUF6176 family protein [Jeotgalibacillus aurantiacus]